MPLSRLGLAGADLALTNIEADSALILKSATATYLLAPGHLHVDDAPKSELEEALHDDGGGRVYLATLAALEKSGELRHQSPDFELRELKAKELQELWSGLEVGPAKLGRLGDSAAQDLLMLIDRGQAVRPAMRRLFDLPSERCGGLLPFLTAVGAEPYVIMADLEPLVSELRKRGEEWVAVVAKAGAFLWHLDLRGREGIERQAAERIDADVILPLTMGLPQSAHIRVGGSMDQLIREARAATFDLAFILPESSPESLAELEKSGQFPSFACDTSLPFGLTLD